MKRMPTHDLNFLFNRVFSGFCPDVGCQTRLVFPSYEPSIECINCGQRHERKSLKDVEEVTDPNILLQNMLRNVLLRKNSLKRGVEAVKVRGLSNTHCKLLSSILTRYGMEKVSGEARLLIDLKQGEIFDCGLLGERCFRIDPEHIDVVGYGRDISGSCMYLRDTLATISVYNGNEERLIPIHADGDGHCLVHAISRALVGRELFWHPLRTNLQTHFRLHLDKYKELFRDFIYSSEWVGIIDECDPEFEPQDGELLGLRNIHVFGLANVLRRPIILLDSLQGMQSCGDYTATFLPALIEPSLCRGKSGELNKPLCIAWSSSARNHYISLVGISNKPVPRLPRTIVPKAWGLPHSYIEKYIDFDADGFCFIGGDKSLQDIYLSKLVSAIEKIFFSQHNVHPAIVADVHHYIYKKTGVVGVKLQDVIQNTKEAVAEKRLFICLLCYGICEQNLVPESFRPGGPLYTLAEQKYGKLEPNKLYPFPLQGVLCIYNAETNELVPTGRDTVIEKCTWCSGNHIRLVNGDGSIQYKNGDRTRSVSQSNYCRCGFKHYWDGKEYDGIPQMIPISMEWAGRTIKEEIPWFQNEVDPFLNSNVYVVASALVQKYFPGVFGSERLVQKVVDQILEQTKMPEEVRAEALPTTPKNKGPSKIILSGIGGIIHKEELCLSEAERLVSRRIKENAPTHQRRRSAERSSSSKQNSSINNIAQMRDVQIKTASGSLNENNQNAKSSSTSTMIRIVTSDGRQLRLLLDFELSRSTFIHRLTQELNVNSSQIKKVMYGFPPKDLLTSANDTLPFQSGDRVSVDLAQVTEESESTIDSEPLRSSEILQTFQDMQNSNTTDLDAAVASIILTTTFTNRPVWSHLQNLPHLFQSGGLLYNVTKRDIGLVDNKHFRLPILPDKIFRYNASLDRLELCLEPIGHFAVEPDVELKAQKLVTSDFQRGVGPTGVINMLNVNEDLASVEPTVVNKNVNKASNPSYFHGQGYSLRSNSENKREVNVENQMVEDNHFETRDEQMDTDIGECAKQEKTTVPTTIRKGPGFSVLNPEVANIYSTHAEVLRYFTSQLPVTVEEEGINKHIEEEEDDDIGEDKQTSL